MALLPHTPNQCSDYVDVSNLSYGLGSGSSTVVPLFYSRPVVRSRVPDESDSFSLADLIITSVAAMALSGFGLLFLGFARLLNHFGMLIALDLAERGRKVGERDRGPFVRSRSSELNTKFPEI